MAAMTEEDMEQWQHVFQELIQEVKPWHKWTLTQDKDLLPDVLKPGWTQYQQKTFARFHCSFCSRSWASGRVLIVFYMRWCEKAAKGQVKMRVFAQRCNQCPKPPFAAPEFTWDNISRILNNLLFRILKKCYKEGFKQMGEIPLLGDTSLEGPHDSGNCEACLLGFCAQNDLGQASKPPAPPLSPTSSSKSTREPKVTATSSNIPCSSSSSKVEKPQASKVKPQTSKVKPQASKVKSQASNPSKNDPKVSCTSEASILTVQQLSEVSSPAPRCVIQMPSPINSIGAADITKKNTRPKAPKALCSSSLYVPPTSSLYVPPTSSLHSPPTSSLYVPPTSCLHSPPTSSLYVPPTSSLHSPPTSSLYVPPTSSLHSPPTSSLYVPPTSSLHSPPTSSLHSPPTSSSWRPPANTTCQVGRSSHIPPQSQSSCCEACCAGCCENFGGCCTACGNCMSQSPLCCLVFLILFLLLWYLV